MRAALAAAVLACAASAAAVAAWAQQPNRAEMMARGEQVWKDRCASCHDDPEGRTPAKKQLAARWADEVVGSLSEGGVMAPMAVGLTRDDIRAVAFHVTGSPPGFGSPPQTDPPACKSAPAFTLTGSSWNGWSPDHTNHRYQANPGLKAEDLPRLKVKWAMTYIGARYGHPVVMGGRLYVASSTGRVYALDPATGCMHWKYEAGVGVRTMLVIGRSKASPSGYAAYLGDYARNMHALDAVSGKRLWRTNVEDHPKGVLTGTPVLYEGRLYVPVSSWEEVMGAAAAYECCSFRGSVVAMDPETGKVVWKTYVIEQAPSPHKKNAAGTTMLGPAGAAIWSAPTIDPKRKQIYVATGDSYTDVKETSSDAVIALDLATGRIKWKHQVTAGDNYLMGCGPRAKGVNCPENVGPDVDFGASPILLPVAGGKDVLIAGQKSGVAYGFDPDTGKMVWQTRIGEGGALGGIEWGFATEGKRAYVSNADTYTAKPRRGVAALDPATGKELWFTPTPKEPCGWKVGTNCVSASSAAPVMIPGAVIASSIDGRLRAYDPADGRITWTFDTAGQRYQTINGVTDQGGGALDQHSATVAGGMLFVISGYTANMGGVPNNVLLAFSVDGK